MGFLKAAALGALSALLVAGVAQADIVNVAGSSGVEQGTIRTFSVTPGDYNKDGLDDFFLVRHAPENLGANIPPSTLYRGTGSGFNELPTSFAPGGKNTDKHGCDWGDVNVDGRMDLFCAIGLTQFSKNELWIQNADGSFSEVAKAWGLHQGAHGRYRYATFIFANNDTRPDIYVARYTGSCYCDLNGDGQIDYEGDSWPNELWINYANGDLRHAPEYGLDQPIGAKKDNATCAQSVDFDDDGDEDLLVCGYTRLKLYQNNNGTGFTDVAAAKGITGDAQDARLVKLNGDNLYDLVRLNRTKLLVRYGTELGKFGAVQTLVGELTAGEALAFGRFDGDGSLDLYQLGSRAKFKKDQPDRILLNGAPWQTFVIPGVSEGAGDDVGAVDYDNDGTKEFLVTNGDRKIYGPVQLFDWR
jgi:hypothetical protein